jgi:predicted secreted protein
MTRPTRWFALVLSLAVFAACGGGGGTIQLSERDSGTSVEAKVGNTLVLTLVANHSTPYHWVLTQAPDPSILVKTSNTYESEGGQPGSGGQEIWKFRARGEGSTALQLVYQSVNGAPNGDRFSISVHVSP